MHAALCVRAAAVRLGCSSWPLPPSTQKRALKPAYTPSHLHTLKPSPRFLHALRPLAGRGSARKLAQVTPTGILYSDRVKDLSDLAVDDEAAELEAAAQVGDGGRTEGRGVGRVCGRVVAPVAGGCGVGGSLDLCCTLCGWDAAAQSSLLPSQRALEEQSWSPLGCPQPRAALLPCPRLPTQLRPGQTASLAPHPNLSTQGGVPGYCGDRYFKAFAGGERVCEKFEKRR